MPPFIVDLKHKSSLQSVISNNLTSHAWLALVKFMAFRSRFHPYSTHSTAAVTTSTCTSSSTSTASSGSSASVATNASGARTASSGSSASATNAATSGACSSGAFKETMPPTLPTHPLSPALGHIISTISSLRISLDQVRMDLNKLKKDFEEFALSNFSIESSVYKVCVMHMLRTTSHIKSWLLFRMI